MKESSMTSGRQLAFHSTVIVAYVAITLLMTYPLVLHLTTHVPGGGGDAYVNLWNLWWVKHALVDMGTNPYYTDVVLHPHRTDLGLHALTFINGLLSIPLQALMGLATINNLFILLSFVMSAYGMFLLALSLVDDWRAAFLAGLIFAFSSYRMAHLEGHVNLIMTQWMPFYVLFLLRAFREEEKYVRDCLAAGLFLGITFLSEATLFIFLLFFTFAAVSYITITESRKGVFILGKISLVALASLPFVLPVAIVSLKEKVSGAYDSIPVQGSSSIYVADALGFLSPGPRNPWFGGISLHDVFTGGEVENMVFIGFVSSVLLVAGIAAGRREKGSIGLWVIGLLIFAILSLGPRLHLLGREYPVPLPFGFLQSVPPLDHLRAPGRFHVMTMFCAAMLAAFGARWFFARARFLWVLASILVLMEVSIGPVHLAGATVPEVYEFVGEDEGAETVLDIPLFVGSGFGYLGSPFYATMLHQSIHGKRILGGFISRLPYRDKLSYLYVPFFRTILALDSDYYPVPREQMEADRRVSFHVMEIVGLDYVVVHKASAQPIVDAYLRYVLPLEKLHEDESVIVYRTDRPSAGTLEIDAGSESSVPYLYRGWINGQAEEDVTYAWSTGYESIVLLNLRGNSDHVVELRLKPHERLPHPEITVGLNGKVIERLKLASGWNSYRLRLPGDLNRSGADRLTFAYGATIQTSHQFSAPMLGGRFSDYTFLDTVGSRSLADNMILDWEQDNEKFNRRGSNEVSVALDYVRVLRPRVEYGPVR